MDRIEGSRSPNYPVATQAGRGSRLTAALVALALFFSWAVARADDAEDQFVRVYGLIQQGDAQAEAGKNEAALTKYRAAKTALQDIQRGYPNWNSSVVAFRLSYVERKIAEVSGKAPAITTQTNRPAGAPQAGTPVTEVKLLEPGSEPRTLLRLHPKAGDKESFSNTITMEMEMGAGDMPAQKIKMPAMTTVMEVTVKEVATNGDIAFDAVIADAQVAKDAGVTPQMAQAIEGSFVKLKGISGHGVLSDRGAPKTVNFTLPENTEPQLRANVEQMVEGFSRFAPPLPEQPVGAGARWEAHVPLKSQGITIQQTAVYELVSLQGDKLSTKSTISQSAADQKIENPAMPGLKMDLVKMTGNGQGSFNYNLSKLLPESGSAKVHTEMSMSMNMGGQKQALKMNMDLNVTVQAK